MKILHQSLRIGLSLLIITAGIVVIRWRFTTHIKFDYIEYWSAAKLAITGGDPYSTDEMLKLEQENGWQANIAIPGLPVDYAHMMFNPPWTIFFIIPFGVVDYLTSRAIFFLLSIGILIFSVDKLWKSLGGKISHIWIVLLLVFSFPASIQEINLGNIIILPFLGIVIFMLLVKQKKFFWAGTTLSLVLIKPQNTYLFLVALVVWILVEKQWMVLFGASVGLVISTSVVLLFIPDVIEKYITLMSMNPTAPWLNATIGSFLRLKLGFDQVWLIYLPIVLGLIWFVWYWLSNRNSWNWDEAIPYLLVASAATTPFGWLLDIILVIPAIIYITWRIFYRWKEVQHAQRIGIM